MNYAPLGCQRYQATHLETQVSGASPLQLVLLLTDGLLDELARARGHIEGRRIEAKRASIDRCVAMLNGLAGSIDIDNGTETAKQLVDLYDHCAWRVADAGARLEIEPLDHVVRLITDLREGWQGALDAE